ncbi:transketolase [Pseudomonas sp. NPDC089554]|uniref:transketolase n=1 Tax=Pseudomonas sp. NPDC089554 TaxID=3390653 RepID=UPI003D02E7A3
MLAISKFARWLKEPSREVAVVIVSSTALAEDVSQGLEAAIADWNEVAHLRVEDMEGLQANWLATDVAHASGECQASELLRAVSKRCYLLDLESDGSVRLAWLGSVCGHELRCLQLEPALAAQGEAQEQVVRVVEVARSLVKTILEERFAP